MTVDEIMQRDVLTVEPQAPIKDVARLLVERGISGVPVAEGTRVVGVVSEQDIVLKERGVRAPEHRHRSLFGHDESDDLKRQARTAADAMTCPAVVVEPHCHVAEAARLMVAHDVNRLPVVVHGELVGIVTRTDLVRAFTRSDAEVEREIRDDVLLATLWIDPSRIEITVRNGEVRPVGEVDTEFERELLTAYVARVAGVVLVNTSDLRYQPPSSHVKARREP